MNISMRPGCLPIWADGGKWRINSQTGIQSQFGCFFFLIESEALKKNTSHSSETVETDTAKNPECPSAWPGVLFQNTQHLNIALEPDEAQIHGSYKQEYLDSHLLPNLRCRAVWSLKWGRRHWIQDWKSSEETGGNHAVICRKYNDMLFACLFFYLQLYFIPMFLLPPYLQITIDT